MFRIRGFGYSEPMPKRPDQKGTLYWINGDLKGSHSKSLNPPLWLRAANIEMHLSLELLLQRHADFERLHGPR